MWMRMPTNTSPVAFFSSSLIIIVIVEMLSTPQIGSAAPGRAIPRQQVAHAISMGSFPSPPRPRSHVTCTAAFTATASELSTSSEFQPPSSPIVPIVQGLLSVPLVFDLAANAARNKVRMCTLSCASNNNNILLACVQIKDRAATIGVDFDQAVARIQRARDWDAALASVTNRTITSYPEYYTKPFHGVYIDVPINKHRPTLGVQPTLRETSIGTLHSRSGRLRCQCTPTSWTLRANSCSQSMQGHSYVGAYRFHSSPPHTQW